LNKDKYLKPEADCRPLNIENGALNIAN